MTPKKESEIGNLNLTKEEIARLRHYVGVAKAKGLDAKDTRELINQFECARLGTEPINLENTVLGNAFRTYHHQLSGGVGISEFPALSQAYKDLCEEYGVDADLGNSTSELSDEVMRQHARQVNKSLLRSEESVVKSFLPKYVVKNLGKYRIPVLVNSGKSEGPFSKEESKRWFEAVRQNVCVFHPSVSGDNLERLKEIGSQCNSVIEQSNYSRRTMTNVLELLYDVLDSAEVHGASLEATRMAVEKMGGSFTLKRADYKGLVDYRIMNMLGDSIEKLAARYGGIVHRNPVRRNSVGELMELSDDENAKYSRLPVASASEKQAMAEAGKHFVEDYEPIVRACAVTILACTMGYDALPIFREMANDPNPQVTEALVRTLPGRLYKSDEADALARQIVENEKQPFRHQEFHKTYDIFRQAGNEKMHET